MPSPLKLALALLPLCLAISAPQAAAKTHDDDSDTVRVSFEQGQALADFAVQSGARVRPKPDCSHLVHLLYSRAGLIYPYEDSRVLYRGVEDFERVKTPQPGDLVVWLGHVGIVLSPEDKTFFSSVRSGIITESWTAPHWLRRGRPRFLRYRIGPSANLTLLAAIMDDSADTQRHTNAQRSMRAQNNNNDDRNSDRGNSRSTAAAQIPFPASDRNTVQQIEQDEPAAQDDRNAASHSEDPQQVPQHAVPQRERAESPAIVATVRQYQTPGKGDIVAAMLESSATRSRQLIAGQTLDLARPLSVFERVEVTRIRIKHQSGSVTLKLVESMSQEAGRIVPGKTIERELSLVRQSNGVWVISDPRERTYVPESQAVSVFERQAELFLRDAPNSSATRAVVKALDRLYDLQADTAQRAAVR